MTDELRLFGFPGKPPGSPIIIRCHGLDDAREEMARWRDIILYPQRVELWSDGKFIQSSTGKKKYG